MRRIITAALAATATAALSGCSAVAGASSVETRGFPVAGFDAVRVGGSDTVKIVRGPTAAVSARGPAGELDKLDIRTEGSKLIIGRKSTMGVSWSIGEGVVVTVTLPAIRAAEVAGSSDVTLDRADGAEFEATVSGSGSLDIAEVAAASTKLGLKGSGSIEARGTTGVLSADVTGSGDLKAERLRADTASIAIKGSGSARAFASKSAALTVTGSGDATVAGTRQCAITTRGSGEARCTG